MGKGVFGLSRRKGTVGESTCLGEGVKAGTFAPFPSGLGPTRPTQEKGGRVIVWRGKGGSTDYSGKRKGRLVMGGYVEKNKTRGGGKKGDTSQLKRRQPQCWGHLIQRTNQVSRVKVKQPLLETRVFLDGKSFRGGGNEPIPEAQHT